MNTAYPYGQPGQYFNRDEPKYKCCCGNMHVTTGPKAIAILVAIGLVLQTIYSVIALTREIGHYRDLGYVVGSSVVIAVMYSSLLLGLRSQRALSCNSQLVRSYNAQLNRHSVFQLLVTNLCVLLFLVCVIVITVISGIGVFSFLIGVFIVFSLFLGLRSERAAFLIPYLVFQALGVVLCVVLIVMCIIALAKTSVGFAQDFIKRISINSSDLDEHGVKIFSIVYIVVLVFFIIIEVWFFWVVYKCYNFFREQAAFDQTPLSDTAAE